MMDAQIKTEAAKEAILSLDIRRSVILCAYIKEWGMPEYRFKMGKNNTHSAVELYFFPAKDKKYPARFATVGLSNFTRKNGKRICTEFMLALESGLGNESIDRVFTYFCDIIAHNIENIESSEPPRVMSESALAPERWTTKAILIDELRGESEELEEIIIGSEKVSLLWVVPINENEEKIILNKGIDAFDEYIENLPYSIINPVRPS